LNRELDGVLLNVGTIRGGSAVNIVPEFASAELNVRISKTDDASRVLQRLQELATPFNQRDGYRLEISGRFNRLPKETTPVEEKLFLAWQRCARDLGVNVSWQDVAGGSDGNLLAAAGLSTLDGLGPVGDHAHSPDEFVHLSSLAERAAITSRFLQQIASSAIPRLYPRA
jgi:glutamate carboxypeptidase